MPTYSVRYVHKISPSPNDIGPEITLETETTATRTTLGKAFREARILDAGQALHSVRTEADGKVVGFPKASIWQSIVLTPVPPRIDGPAPRPTA